MKTILWATLTANGNYAQSSAEHHTGVHLPLLNSINDH
jgi:hypothetical protein